MISVDQYITEKSGYIYNICGTGTPRFLLPNLQRSFKWGDEKIKQLWHDLSEYRAVNKLTTSFDYGNDNTQYNTTPPYLLGTIYVTKGDYRGVKVRSLIDGQQRLTTIYLSILVFREIYFTLTDDHEIEQELKELNKRLGYPVKDLFETDAKNVLIERGTPRLIYPQEENNKFWIDLCRKERTKEFNELFDNDNFQSETQRNIVAAFGYLRKYISQTLVEEEEGAPYLERLAWKPARTSSRGKIPARWDIDGLKKLIKKGNHKGFESIITKLSGLLATLLNAVCLVQFECTAEQQVSLFDIINNRGEQFDMPDMVRLMLFSRIDQTKHEELNSIWTKSNVNKEFLPWVWNAFYASPNNLAKNKLQIQINEVLRGEEMSDSSRTHWIFSFAKRCEKSADLIEKVESFNKVLFSDKNFDKVAFLTANEYTKFSRPIFLALESHDINEVEKERIYKLLSNFLIRATVAHEKDSKLLGNTLPKLAVSICEKIRNTKQESYKEQYSHKPPFYPLLTEIKNILKESPVNLLITDEAFKDKFASFTLGSKQIRFGYMVIGSFEQYLLTKNRSAVTLTYYANEESGSCCSNNLEHIYPQNPDKKAWPKYGPEVDGYINKFGNFLVLNSGMNSGLGNKPIQVKLGAYKNARLELVTDIEKLINSQIGQSEPGSWTAEKIEERTKLLAEQAVKVFSLDIA